MKQPPELTKGTTLVEVIVGSVLLISIIGIITLALTTVFEIYASTQQRGAIDQDAQYILARLQYVGMQQDSRVILSQDSYEDFSIEGYQSTNITIDSSEGEGMYLTNTQLSGEYVSPSTPLNYTSLASQLIASVKRPTGSQITYQVAVADMIGGSCADANYTFVGPDGTGNTSFTTDYFLIPHDNDSLGFENPGECLRYRAVLMGNPGGETPVIYQVSVMR